MIRKMAVPAALTLMLATGCAGGDPAPAAAPTTSASPTASPVTPGPPWYDEVPPAEAGITIGDSNSGCDLPITFSIPAGWRVKQIPAKAKLKVGRVTLSCEIDAKPAGLVGFLRVWTVDERLRTDAKTEVSDFVTEYAQDDQATYRRTKAGPLDSVEASYVQQGIDGKPNPQRAIAVRAILGDVVVTVGGMDAEEFQSLLPGFQLAKRSVKRR
ncbi:lipoprotein [Micromonospora sp. SL4-19]|uniref:lipoprotein n=1 Tax=Micromonospora sp. SL4-19 TaxID=3399129 RepID=UPI003A4D769F